MRQAVQCQSRAFQQHQGFFTILSKYNCVPFLSIPFNQSSKQSFIFCNQYRLAHSAIRLLVSLIIPATLFGNVFDATISQRYGYTTIWMTAKSVFYMRFPSWLYKIHDPILIWSQELPDGTFHLDTVPHVHHQQQEGSIENSIHPLHSKYPLRTNTNLTSGTANLKTIASHSLWYEPVFRLR